MAFKIKKNFSSFFFKSTKFYLSIEVQSENTKEFKIFLQNIHANSSTLLSALDSIC